RASVGGALGGSRPRCVRPSRGRRARRRDPSLPRRVALGSRERRRGQAERRTLAAGADGIRRQATHGPRTAVDVRVPRGLRAPAGCTAVRRDGAGPPRSPPPRERSRGPVHVNVTILLRGALRASTSGRAPTLREATADGARRAAHDARFGPMLSIAELDDATVELWVQRSRLPLSPRAALESLDLGADGVDLECDGARAY